MNFLDFFDKAAKEHQDKIALVDKNGNRHTSYNELDKLSGRIAAKLKTSGLAEGSFVMIYLDRCAEYVAAYIGVLKAGCVVVPVIKEYPRERIEYIKKHSEADTVINEEFMSGIDAYESMESAYLEDNAPAILIYTSGSTGTPKGILHTVGALGAAISRQGRISAALGKVVFGATAPMSFVAFAAEYLATFKSGGCVHILNDEIRKNIRLMEKYFEENGVNVAFISPQLLRFFKGTKDFKIAFAGSEALRNVYSDSFAVYNCYGMTETLASVCSFKLDKAYDNTPVGKPSDGIEIFIVDENGNEVPDGENGEIYIKGHIANCYYKMPEQSERVFYPQEDGTTIFHTGDIGYKNENGDLVYVNRKDWMVKINGQRVETMEIEKLINDVDGVTNAAVQAFDDNNRQKYLAAFYTAEKEIDENSIVSVLKAKLPDYMIPRYFKQLDEMPKNVNGKLDRRALRPPEISDYKTEYVEPANETEAALCKSIENVLECGRVGVKDDFISLGGDSIKVIALVADAGIDGLTPAMVLEGRTAEKIAELYAENINAAVIEHNTELKSSYPLTEAQLGVYLECIEEPQSVMYNLPMYCELPPKTDTDKFAAAVKAVFESHKVFGVKIDSTPSMVLSDFSADIEIKSADSLKAYLKGFIRPFDLAEGPLWRAEIVNAGERKYFVFDIHHIIFDGSSVKALVDQIADAYNGKETEDEQLNIFDIAMYEASMKETDEYKAAEAYFEKTLGGIDTDSRPVPDIIKKDAEKGACRVTVSMGEDIDILQAERFTRERGITENTLFLGAFAYTLAKFIAAKDTLFCTVNNGRHDARLSGSIGMFVKTLPMYFNISEDESVTEFLKKTQDYFFETMKHDCISFGELAANYGIGADIAFVYQAELLNGAMIEGEEMTVNGLDSGDVQFDIDAMIMKSKIGYELNVNYRSDLYSEALIKSFSEMLIAVIRGMLTADKLGDIELITLPARAVIDAFNMTDAPYDESVTVIDLFREQARKNPQNIAAVFKDVSLTYKELDKITDILAKNLKSYGIGREKVTAVLIPRSEYIAICSLGALKAGGAYMPLDPTYPPERLNLMVEDSGAEVLITTKELSFIITDDFKGKRIMLDEIPVMEDIDITLEPPKPNDRFIMLYTSGTTGLPKGVMLEHGNLNTFCAWHRKTYGMDNNARIAAYASYGFDACMHDLYPALTAGSCVYIIDEEMRLDLNALHKYFAESKITHAFMTTQIGRQFAKLGNPGSLKLLTTGGEKLVPVEPPKDFTLCNVYGPTECTIFSSMYEMKELERDVPIGKSLDNMKFYVTDALGRMLPAGAVGELWIAGPQVARGYLNRPEQTAASFTKNPFSDEEKYSRVYHTGDIVRFMPDGNIQFIGRRDAQVKIRGFRIELTEVEEVIRRFDGIKDATVAAFDDPAGGKFIAAYVVSDETVDIDALNNFILSEKPPYMVPAVTMQIDKIPVNQNQKVNKRALPVPERKIENAVPPQNETQQRIFDCIAEVIGHKEFGINTNIYFAGLTSIGAVRLNVLLSDEFNVAVSSRDLKDNDTVEKLELFFNNAAPQEDFEALPDYGITKTQEGIFIECMADKDSTVYNIPILLRISDKIDTDKLTDAIEKAVNAHPYIMAKLFLDENGDIRQRRTGEVFIKDDVEIITAGTLDDVRPRLIRPFNLMGGRLFRISIIKADKTYLYIEMHHIISDGTSVSILLDDISRIYQGESVETERYSGFEVSLTEEKLRNSDYYDKAKKHYTDLFGECDADCLPPGDLKEKAKAQSAAITVFGEYTTPEDVKRFCEENKLSLNGFFTAAFGLTLTKYCRKENAVFATIYNGRNDSRLSRSMAMLVKTYPVICAADKDKANVKAAEYVADIGEQLINSMSCDIYSFAEISRAFSISADVMFAYQGDDFVFDELCGEKAEMLSLKLDQAKAPLNLNVYLDNGRVKFFCEYRSDRYSREYIESFLDAYDNIIAELMTGKTISEISALSDKARAEIESFNDTEGEVENLTVPRMIERQASLTPDKTAVTAGGESITFAELNARANKIANTLIDKGVKGGDVVGLYMDRTIDVYPIRQGIMKSGGAFLSAEPDYPDDRIAYIFENSKAKYVITTKELYESRKELLDSLDASLLLIGDIYTSDKTKNPDVSINSSSLAYCIYTSGSTGKPKGVMIEHRNLMNMLAYHDKNILAHDYVDNTSTFLGLAAITFDVSVIEEMMPLCHGQSVAMATEDEIHNPILLARMMEETGVDMMKCTPSYMQTMLDFPEVCETLKKLRAVIIGAEPFPEMLYKRMRDIGFEGKIFNSYGPTETTVTVTIAELDGKMVTIGKPAGNTKIYMLDSFGHILPKYARGELVITGKSVGRGYVGLDEMTKEKFITYNGSPAYRSGDIAYWNADGNIIHCGRSDNQIKLRGLRVELDEIENVMNRFEGIKRSVVLVKGEGNDQYLCGYYVAEAPVDISELTKHMEKTLTKYMIPSVFVHLLSLPMTTNGKVDKKALPEPEFKARETEGAKADTELEKKFCDMFALALGVDTVYADDDFFEMGGTSLSASKIAMKCMTENLPIVYKDVFDYPTPQKLAAFVASQTGGEQKPVKTQSKSAQGEKEDLYDVLKDNTPSQVADITYTDIGNVLLTGSTGFLGVHVLKKLIESGTKKIYCLVRKNASLTAERRLQNMLMYYFDNPYRDLFGERIFAIDGDITDEGLYDAVKDIDFDTVINCAACVKHFTNDDILERVNTRGVENLIDICLRLDKKLVQVSTVSVAGTSVDGSVPDEVSLKENMLDFGQTLDNDYARTKWMAEKALLTAVKEKGLRGKIVRVGNLMSRYEDGEFQVNFNTNGFMNRLKAYAAIGAFPVSAMDMRAEFSAIDATAEAIIRLAGTPDKFTVFHANSCHTVHMANVLDALREKGIDIKIVKEQEFGKAFEAALADETRNMDVSALISYNSHKTSVRAIDRDNTFTVKALYRLGFSWPLVNEDYIERAMEALITLDFFESNGEF